MEKSICRIFRGSSDEIVGAGVFVGHNQILTNAHVINRARGADIFDGNRPDESSRFKIDFPFISSDKLGAWIVRWSPPKRSKRYRDDIATLMLEDMTSHNYVAAKLAVDRIDFRGLTVRAYGFPEYNDDGIWVEGKVQGRVTNERVQIDDPESHGYFIVNGFSGTPVFDEQLSCVYGIISLADSKHRSAFMIPAWYLNGYMNFQEPIKGSDSWKLNFFRSTAMTALLNDLGNFEKTGLSQHICETIQLALARIADATSDFEGQASWENPIHHDFDKICDTYIEWNDYPEGTAGMLARRETRKRLRNQRKILSDKIRQCRGVLYQQSIYDEADEDMFDTIFSAFREISDSKPNCFANLRTMLAKYDSRRDEQ